MTTIRLITTRLLSPLKVARSSSRVSSRPNRHPDGLCVLGPTACERRRDRPYLCADSDRPIAAVWHSSHSQFCPRRVCDARYVHRGSGAPPRGGKLSACCRTVAVAGDDIRLARCQRLLWRSCDRTEVSGSPWSRYLRKKPPVDARRIHRPPQWRAVCFLADTTDREYRYSSRRFQSRRRAPDIWSRLRRSDRHGDARDAGLLPLCGPMPAEV